jgi:selenide,water dikinase
MSEHRSKKKLILVGCGHAHLLVLKSLSTKDRTDLEIIMISEQDGLNYTGMLPGLLAGAYRPQDIYISVQPWLKKLGARFIQGRVTSVNFTRKSVLIDAEEMSYDLLSLNVGGRPEYDLASVKPFAMFHKKYMDFLTSAAALGSVAIVIVGGGVGGIECAFAFRQRFQSLGVAASISLIESQAHLLPDHNPLVQRAIKKHLDEKKIHVFLGSRVCKITSTKVELDHGQTLASDFTAVTTAVQPDDWVKKLNLNHYHSFIEVDSFLQTSQPSVFAVGDVAVNPRQFWPHSGVTAVRQAPVLAHNILATLNSKPLKEYHAQKTYLSLISDGNGKALLSKGRFYWPFSRTVWQLKDRIDRRFIRQFSFF